MRSIETHFLSYKPHINEKSLLMQAFLVIRQSILERAISHLPP